MSMQRKDAFIALIKENEAILFKVSKAYSKQAADQQDLYQEIVYQLWKSFASFKGESKISTWIYRVALNTCITHSKRKRKQVQGLALDGNLSKLVDLPEKEADKIWEERLQFLYKEIKKLSLIDRALILLFLEGESYEAIGEIVGFSASNVGTRLGRIKQKLKKNAEANSNISSPEY